MQRTRRYLRTNARPRPTCRATTESHVNRRSTEARTLASCAGTIPTFVRSSMRSSVRSRTRRSKTPLPKRRLLISGWTNPTARSFARRPWPCESPRVWPTNVLASGGWVEPPVRPPRAVIVNDASQSRSHAREVGDRCCQRGRTWMSSPRINGSGAIGVPPNCAVVWTPRQ